MKEFTIVSGLWVALSEFTQEETALSDLSRLLQSPLHSQGQCQSFFSSNKRSYSRRRALFNLPDYLVVSLKVKKAFEFAYQMYVNLAKLQNTPQLISASLTCVGRL